MSDTASPPLEEGASQLPAASEATTSRSPAQHAAPTSGPCLNCGVPLADHFCSACGQKAVTPDPTFHDLWHEFTHEMLHVDGRLFQSTKLLFLRPGFLTREYCQGRRARYLTPLRLYLIFSVLFFAVVAAWPPPTTVRQDAKLGQVVTTGGLRVSGERLLGKMTPEQVAERVQRAEHEWLPRLMFVLVPVAALLVMAVTRREKRHLPEHLYFVLHVHAALFGAFVIAHLLRLLRLPHLSPWIALFDVLFVAIYTTIAMHTVYGGTWARALIRTTALGFSYWFVLIVVVIAVLGAVLVLQ